MCFLDKENCLAVSHYLLLICNAIFHTGTDLQTITYHQ